MAFVFLGPPGEQGGRTVGAPPQAPSVKPCSPDALGSRVGEESVASTATAFTRVPSALTEGGGSHGSPLSVSALNGAEVRPVGALPGSPAAGSFLPSERRSNASASAPLSAPTPTGGPLLPAGDSLVSGRAPLLLAGLSLAAPLAYSLVVLTGAAL